jgi:ABC-type cobalamin transport system ATPase subunit
LILKAGKVLAAGGKDAVLKARNLSSAFGAPTLLKRKAGRYSLLITRPSRRVV